MDVLNTHLPRILDLASNFNLDLSGVLSEYAQKLRDDVPELMENFSFPEAALLLQHCAEIYGRKVDYVHTLAVELCENMNVRFYGSEPGQGEVTQETTALSPKKLSGRKRKTVAIISTEDFKLQSFSLDKPIIVNRSKKKKTKKHSGEAVCVRLSVVNLPTTHEYHIYDDDTFASIGTKDQFRLNWPIEQNCRLEEYIMDEGSGNSWSVCDVGVSNMLTPEYSDEGAMDARCSTPMDDRSPTPVLARFPEPMEAVSPMAEVTSENPLTDIPAAEIEQAIEDVSEQTVPSNVSEQIVTLNVSDQPKEKPVTSTKTTFKLPYELTKKGLKGAKPERNLTLFLFSDLLKRDLGIKGPLPPISSKNTEKKLIAKHVDFLIRRYNLDKRKTSDAKSLLEEQADFLGFEEEVLPNVPEVLTATTFPKEPRTPTRTKAKDCDVRESSTFDADGYDNDWEAGNSFQETMQIEYQEYQAARKANVVDEQGVRNWRQFIQSKLVGEEEQKKFDVHTYGSDIINSFHNVGETLSFGDVVGGRSEREISRYFVSTLMLANTTNLFLQDSGRPNTLRMTLQHTERSHEMEDILVPPSVGGITTSTSTIRPQTKRKSVPDNEEGETPHQQRFLKQIPGEGPWKNKSKKGRKAE